MRSMPTGGRRPPRPPFHPQPIHPRPRGPREGGPAPAPTNHPSVSWAYCAPTDKLHRYRRTGGPQQGMSNPTGPDENRADQSDTPTEKVELPKYVRDDRAGHRDLRFSRRSHRGSAPRRRTTIHRAIRIRRVHPEDRHAARPGDRGLRATGRGRYRCRRVPKACCPASHPTTRRACPSAAARYSPELGLGDRGPVGDRGTGGHRGARHRPADPKVVVDGAPGGRRPHDDPELRLRHPARGDLASLRSITCGTTRDNYVKYDQKAWDETHARVEAAKQYPVVASIDQVVVNGDHAEANVTSFMAFAPQTRSTRSFDLQFRDNQWKVCQAPTG